MSALELIITVLIIIVLFSFSPVIGGIVLVLAVLDEIQLW